MTLNVEVGFHSPETAVEWGFMGYKSSVSADRQEFRTTDFEKQSYALKILNEEFKSAVEKTNKRLLAEGFGKESFRKPLFGCDEAGNKVDVLRHRVF